MGERIIDRKPIDRNSRILKKLGLHEINTPRGGYEENPFTCPFGIEGYCEGYMDAEHTERCEVSHPAKLLNCDLYVDFVTKPEVFLYPLQVPRVDPNADTVIMHGDEVVKNSTSFDSIHDRIADGADIRRFFEVRKTLRTEPADYRADF